MYVKTNLNNFINIMASLRQPLNSRRGNFIKIYKVGKPLFDYSKLINTLNANDMSNLIKILVSNTVNILTHDGGSL